MTGPLASVPVDTPVDQVSVAGDRIQRWEDDVASGGSSIDGITESLAETEQSETGERLDPPEPKYDPIM